MSENVIELFAVIGLFSVVIGGYALFFRVRDWWKRVVDRLLEWKPLNPFMQIVSKLVIIVWVVPVAFILLLTALAVMLLFILLLNS